MYIVKVGRMRDLVWLVILCNTLFLSCSSSGKMPNTTAEKQTQQNHSAPSTIETKPQIQHKAYIVSEADSQLPNPKEDFGPEDILLIAKITRVDQHSTAFTDYPCSTYPCLAEAEVIEVLERGRTYPGNVKSGDILTFYFPMTLSPSDVVFKDKKSLPYSGLSAGSVFQAKVTGSQFIDDEKNVQHIVVAYSKDK
jgi:hypothetical protein